MNVGGIQPDFGCHQGWTASRISFFSWWNKENRVLIFPILFQDFDVKLKQPSSQDLSSLYAVKMVLMVVKFLSLWMIKPAVSMFAYFQNC